MAQATDRDVTADACNALQRVRLTDHHRATVQRMMMEMETDMRRQHLYMPKDDQATVYHKSVVYPTPSGTLLSLSLTYILNVETEDEHDTRTDEG